MSRPTPRHEPLAVALSLAGRGIPVHPVRITAEGDKRPLTKWGTEATTDPELIKGMWFDHPDAFVGVHAGRGGLLVVDVDEKNGKSGSAALKAAGLTLPKTASYRTLSGGRHHLYRAPDGVELTIAAGKPVEGVDLRAGTGLAVYYGKPLGDAELAPAPSWAVEAARRTREGSAAGQAAPEEVTAWLKAVRKGKPKKGARKVAELIARQGTDHGTMRDALAELVGRGTRGEPGIRKLIEAARDRYVADYPKHARHFDNALAGSIAHHGMPVVTFELPKPKLTAEGIPLPKREVASPRVDVAAIRARGIVPVVPDAGGYRADGERMLYRGKVNGLAGEPEAGKTLVATAMTADELTRGGRAFWADLDHNGAAETIARLEAAGVPGDVLDDPARFYLVVPDAREELAAAVAEVAKWSPTIAVIDSVGEVMAMHGANSNDDGDYTRVHRAVFTPLANAGAAVLVVDHLAKTSLGTGYATGTGAKKRAMDGAYYGVKVVDTFRPGEGGAASLTILKDRHGGVRATSASSTAAVFRLDSRKGWWTWEFHPGRSDAERAATQLEADVEFALGLDPFPSSRTALNDAVRAATGKGWRDARAAAALKTARERRESTFPLDDTDTTTERNTP